MPGLARITLVLALFSTLLSAQWQSGPALPTGGAAREAGVALNKNGAIYLMGGKPLDSNGDSPVHILGTNQTSWTTSTPLQNDFLHHGVQFDALGHFIVWYGLDSGGGEGDCYQWTVADGDAGGIDQPSGQMPFHLFASARDDLGRIYAIGGSLASSQNGTTPVSGRVERYVSTTDTWSVLAPLPTPVSDATACFDGNGHILVFGGITASGLRTANVARYDIATNTWSDTIVADMPTPRSGLRALLAADGRIYAIGGSDGTLQSTTIILDLMTNTWIAGPTMATPRQRFGCALDDAGWIWVLGGTTTNTTEKLFTPTLPNIIEQPTVSNAYLSGPGGFGLIVTGTAPFSYQWRKDGSSLTDGPTANGSTIVGAQTASLGIHEIGFADLGNYDCVITNAAGSVTSSAAAVNLQLPPAMPTNFAASILHPAGAISSVANGVDDGLIGGSKAFIHPTYGQQDKPIMWTGTAASAVDLTPPASVGGAISAVRNGTLVGWWWWPYTNQYGTGYDRHAAIWTNNGASFVNAQPSGWEYGSISDTDGAHHCGSLRYNDMATNGHGFYWPTSNSGAQKLTPPVDWGSAAYAIDGPNEYGHVHIGYGVIKAARWTGGNTQWADMSPPGTSRCYIYGAGDGQQVGRAYYGNPSESGLFAGSAASFVSFDPARNLGVSLNDCEGGLQVGAASIGGVSGAKVWSGNPGSMFDLHQFLPANYSSSVAKAIDVEAGGLITIVGSAYDSVAGTTKAVMWQGQAPTLWQDVAQISASAGGVFHMLVDAGPSHAGQVYAIVGSASGTTPGVMIGANQLLPLNPDFYLDQTILYPNSWIVPSFSYLDATGSQLSTATLPAGALYVVYPVTIHHALVVISPGGSGFDLISAPVALTITP